MIETRRQRTKRNTAKGKTKYSIGQKPKEDGNEIQHREKPKRMEMKDGKRQKRMEMKDGKSKRGWK